MWEYIIVSFQYFRGWRPRFINGYEINDWIFSPMIHDYVEKMGCDGWEIIAASSRKWMYSSSDIHQIYFRRFSKNIK